MSYQIGTCGKGGPSVFRFVCTCGYVSARFETEVGMISEANIHVELHGRRLGVDRGN